MTLVMAMSMEHLAIADRICSAHAFWNDVIGVSISNPAFCTLSNMGVLTDLLIWLHKWIEEKSGEVGRVHPLAQSFLLAFHHECSSDSPGQFICLAYTFHVSIC